MKKGRRCEEVEVKRPGDSIVGQGIVSYKSVPSLLDERREFMRLSKQTISGRKGLELRFEQRPDESICESCCRSVFQTLARIITSAKGIITLCRYMSALRQTLLKRMQRFAASF